MISGRMKSHVVDTDLMEERSFLGLHEGIRQSIEHSAVVALLWSYAFGASQAGCFPPGFVKPNRLPSLSTNNPTSLPVRSLRTSLWNSSASMSVKSDRRMTPTLMNRTVPGDL
jgi:hypothetical protein